MPQLITYIDKDLLKELDKRVQEVRATTGFKTSRSALVTVAIRAFLMPECTKKSTDVPDSRA
ncbi:hypothetical protein F8S13_22190 [Chloroflexia bacterium SDU3-3]|nr:hypothetical protein F8S13_22190 [Chloroflexia bacterium SDU3-3]